MRIREVQGIEFYSGSKEERLPDFAPDFPYIASKVELDKQAGHFVPWHWHKAVELFYMEKGILEYNTPEGKIIFPEGSGGMVNSNVLHMTRTAKTGEGSIQLLHIFDVSLLAGAQGTRIEQKYIMPIVTAPQIEIIALYPEDPKQADIIRQIRKAFRISRKESGYEIKLREALSRIWLQLFEQSGRIMEKESKRNKNSDKIKLMLIYIHEHYSEKISVPELAASAYLSERDCFRVFHDCLHMTPVEYIRSYRLQMACRMLERGNESVTAIGHACGLGNSSYFGKTFREYMNCTPLEYRKRWQNNNI